MTESTSSGQVRRPTTDCVWPAPFRERLRDLGALPADQLRELLDTSVAGVSLDFERPSPTSSAGSSRGDALYFRRVAGALPRITRFVSEQQFEGVVVSVDPGGASFIARLADLTAQGPEEEAEIAFDEISRDDHSLIVPGALFTWAIGRVTEASGQVRRTSEIRFRRFFRFTPSAIAKAELNAAEMLELLNDRDAA